jgi:alpha-ketoglutarate-dependent taurine dioxygenase
MSISSTMRSIHEQLSQSGYVHLPHMGQGGLVDVLETFGRVLHVEEVIITPDSTSLVKSARGLSLHTDHHRAEFIVWYCIAQCDDGGETVLVDAREAYDTLDVGERLSLERIQLQEHSIFDGDTRQHPLVTMVDGRPRFYYSYWLANPGLEGPERAAWDAFTQAVDGCQKQRFRLESGDVLAIDNGRMLHGRTPIGGNQARHLRRYWLTSDDRSGETI